MNKALLTSKNQYWETPLDFFNKLNEEFSFTLDPCAEKSTAKCEKYFDIYDDGLSKCWGGNVCFVNPPYGRNLTKWVSKSCLESRKENTKVVLLIPARTDTKYFHEIIMPFASEIRFLKGRIKFAINGKQKDPAPFPSMIVVFDSADEKKEEKRDDLFSSLLVKKDNG